MKKILIQFAQRDAHPAIQFVKYALAGGVATLVDILVFYFLAWKVFPALQSDDQLVRLFRDVLGLEFALTPVDEAVRGQRFILNSAIAFFFSNLTCYIINILWVFEPGRHKRHVEIGLFFLVSGTSIVLGTALGWGMIRFMGLTTTASYLGKMVASLLINYVCRKYIVFKG